MANNNPIMADSKELGLFEHCGFFREDMEFCQINIMRVKNRREKIMARVFEVFDVPYYLPTYKKVKRYAKGTATHDIPLFSGYVFYHQSPDHYIDILSYNQHFSNIIAVSSCEKDKFLWQLSEIHKTLQSSDVVQPYSHLIPGSEVRIKNGPLKGIMGVVAEVKKKYLFVINVDILGQCVTVEIDPINLVEEK